MAEKKSVMVLGVTRASTGCKPLDHFFLPFSSHGNGQPPFKLVVVHDKPSPSSSVGLVGPAAVVALPIVEADLKRAATRAMEGAKAICLQKSIHDAVIESVEGDASIVLCDTVDKHRASILVVGSHGYDAIKSGMMSVANAMSIGMRAVLGSVSESDYCSHHANGTVMIVKKPKAKRLF